MIWYSISKMLKFSMVAVCLVGAMKTNAGESSMAPGAGTAKGLMAVIMVNAEALAETLPPGLHLAPELNLPEGYPAAMFVGRQEDLVSTIAGVPVTIADAYNEATLTFTVVGPNDATKRYTYTTAIIVDSLPALFAGLAIGYPKTYAFIENDSTQFIAELLGGISVMSVRTRPAIDVDPSALRRNLELLGRNIHPTITLSALGYLCFDFNWDFTAPGAIEPINAEIELSPAFAGAALAAKYQSVQLDKHPFGAVKINSEWQIQNFRSCD